MKYIKLFILIIFVFFASISNCFAKNKITTNKEKIYDYANVYSKLEEKDLKEKIDLYVDSTGIDAFIITTRDLNGKTIDKYTRDFYKKNNYSKNTVLFVIYVNNVEDQIYMDSAGKKVAKYYDDSRVGEILKYVYKYVEDEDYYTASDKYITIIQGFYDLDNKDRGYYLDEDGNIARYIPWIEIIVLSLAVTFIIVMIFFFKLKKNNNNYILNNANNKLNKENMMIKTVKDELINSDSSEQKNL